MSQQLESKRTGSAALLLLAIAGIGFAAYLTYLHVRLHHDPTYVSVCAVSAEVNCETVAASSYSIFLGLPVSVWGLVGYAVLVWVASGRLGRRRSRANDGLLALYTIGLALVSAVLAGIPSFVIGAMCLLCTATYVINFAVAGIAVVMARRRGGLLRCLREDVSSALAEPAPTARGLAIVLFVVVALHIALPRYWELASWRQGTYGASGTTDDGFPWLGAAQPELTIHEYLDYECPHCKAAHRKLRRILSRHRDAIRLVRHDYARMSCAPNDAEKRRASCTMARAGLCATRVGRFWEWNDAVLASPRPLTGDERKSYVGDMARRLELDPERLDACMFEKETVDRAHGVFKDARSHGIRESPGYVVDGHKVSWLELMDLIDEQL